MNIENRQADTSSNTFDEADMRDGMSGGPPTTPAILEAVHLRKYFPLRHFNLMGPQSVVHAVEDTSLSLYPGRALALVGESGSGKTTMARMLARLYEPTEGTIKFRGEPVKVRGRADLRARPPFLFGPGG